MRFKPHNFESRAKLPRLPLAAFIDVCLFLLLYFMLASDLSKPEMALDSTIATDKRGPAQAADLQPQGGDRLHRRPGRRRDGLGTGRLGRDGDGHHAAGRRAVGDAGLL